MGGALCKTIDSNHQFPGLICSQEPAAVAPRAPLAELPANPKQPVPPAAAADAESSQGEHTRRRVMRSDCFRAERDHLSCAATTGPLTAAKSRSMCFLSCIVTSFPDFGMMWHDLQCHVASPSLVSRHSWLSPRCRQDGRPRRGCDELPAAAKGMQGGGCQSRCYPPFASRNRPGHHFVGGNADWCVFVGTLVGAWSIAPSPPLRINR